MKKLSIKDVVDFRKKSEQSKKTFVKNMKLDRKKTNQDSGGDYWISCLSAISNSFKSTDLQLIANKIDELEEKYEKTGSTRTKNMYKRNIDILRNYENYNFEKWRPSQKITFLKKHKEDSIISISGIELKVTPHHVFTLKRNGVNEIGSIWFIAKLNGLRIEELGMFTDILYRYLNTHFSNNYNINSSYCISVDVISNNDVNHSQLDKAEVPSILTSVLGEINRML